jgi:hypothetical protein
LNVKHYTVMLDLGVETHDHELNIHP